MVSEEQVEPGFTDDCIEERGKNMPLAAKLATYTQYRKMKL